MINLDELKKFLVKAKRSTYAAGDAAQTVKEADHSSTLVYEAGDWKYHDNYFGGEPYGGREVVFYQNQPIYIMVYYGRVDSSVEEIKALYGVLQKALSLIPEDKPFRGPENFDQAELNYKNNFIGEVDNFSGEEAITDQNGKIIYWAKYAGGLVNQI